MRELIESYVLAEGAIEDFQRLGGVFMYELEQLQHKLEELVYEGYDKPNVGKAHDRLQKCIDLFNQMDIDANRGGGRRLWKILSGLRNGLIRGKLRASDIRDLPGQAEGALKAVFKDKNIPWRLR